MIQILGFTWLSCQHKSRKSKIKEMFRIVQVTLHVNMTMLIHNDTFNLIKCFKGSDRLIIKKKLILKTYPPPK